ncbi:MAG: hypothetical protein PHU85_20140 [Phycisphaerae bacterium]|jgi:hypothetical protein|nr:hypothetical protein [Phycisphaerae bacterium]
MLTLDILIATRGRPEKLTRVLQSIHETAAHPEAVRVLIYIDPDDAETHAALPKIKQWVKSEHVKLALAKVLCGGAVNQAEAYTTMAIGGDGDIIMYAADDIEFKTPGWDDAVRKAFTDQKDRILLVWCHDPAREDPFPDHGFVSRWSVRCLGYLFPSFPPAQEGDHGISFTDVWLKPLYGKLGRLKYLPDVTIEHVHWKTSEDVPLDDNYVRQCILAELHNRDEMQRRVAEMPQHARRLQKYIDWVAAGGLERVGFVQ